MTNKIELSIIVPVFNEENNISNTFNRLKKELSEQKIRYEIIAVDDGSTDNTEKELRKIKGIDVIKKPYNIGYSSAIKTGIKKSKYDYIMIIDADGTYPIEELSNLLKHVNDYDMVVGARTGKKVYIPFYRKIAKWIIGKLANFLSNQKIPDINSGMRIFRKDVAMEFYNLYPSRFSFTITITLSLLINDYSVKFVPISYAKRKGKSTIHPIKDFLGFLMIIMRVITLFNPIKIFTTISLSLVLIAILIFLYSFFILNNIMDITVIVILLSAVQIFLFGLLAYSISKKR